MDTLQRFIRTISIKNIIIIITLLLPLGFVYFDSNNIDKNITIAAGGTGGAYYQTALDYKKELEKYGVSVDIINTNGSVDIQKLLISGEADFGFVQGGTEIIDKNIESLANIAIEAIWIFHRILDAIDLRDLKGKKIAIGADGSGVLPVSTQLLKVAGIFGDSTLLKLSNKEASEKLISGDIDALFYVAGEQSKLALSMVKTKGIKILRLSKALVYKNNFLQQNNLFQVIKIPAGSFDLKTGTPENDVNLLAKNTILSTNINVHNSLIRLLLKVADKVHDKEMLFSESSRFPNNKSLVQPVHFQSKEYFSQKNTFLEKNFDYWVARSIDNLYGLGLIYLLPILSVISFLFGVVFPTMIYFSRKKIVGWFTRVNKIDSNIIGLSHEEAYAKLDELEKLQIEVRNTDGINPRHMDEFYSLQSHIVMVKEEILICMQIEFKKNN